MNESAPVAFWDRHPLLAVAGVLALAFLATLALQLIDDTGSAPILYQAF
jgi:hypothetical protein